MKRCTQCGRENMDHESFCSACGNSLNQAPAGKSCPSCHSPVTFEDRFCDNCGAALPETPSGGFNPISQNPPNSTRPMSGATPQPNMNPSYPQPVMQQPMMQQAMQQPMMPPQGGYQQFNQAPFPGAQMTTKKSKLPLILSLALVLLLVVGGGLSYYFFFYKNDREVVSPPPTNNQSQNTNTDVNTNTQNTNKSSNKPTPPPTNNNTNTNTVTPLGFKETYRGTFSYPVGFYQAADFHGDGMTEFVAGTTDESSGHIDVLSWDGINFNRISFFDVPAKIMELNPSYPENGKQFIYIPSSNKMLYSLEEQDGSFIYDSLEMVDQPLSVGEGKFDDDDVTDYVILSQKADGTYALLIRPSVAANQEIKVTNHIGNMFLADIDGNLVDDLLYVDQDTDGDVKVFVYVWNGTTYAPAGATSFGDQIINYFPGDIDGDGIAEVVTTNFTADFEIEGRIWKWDTQKQDLILVDVFVIDAPEAGGASPVVGDFTGDGKMDILMLAVPYGNTGDMNFIIYSR